MNRKKTKSTAASPETHSEVKAVDGLIAQAIEKGLPVETVEKLIGMRQTQKDEAAREQYHAALAAFQLACPIIKKNKVVYNKDGKTERYRYATIDSIVGQVKGPLEEFGFNYRTEARIDSKVVEGTTILTHVAGHSEQSSFAVPVGPADYMTEQQAYASALTFVKRYSFLNVTGILTGDEDIDGLPVVVTQAAATEGHRRTKAYDEVKTEDSQAATVDLTALNAFLAEHKMPEAFVLRMLVDRQLIKPQVKSAAGIQPGVLRRLLMPLSLDALAKAWELQQKDEDSGSATVPTPKKERNFTESGNPLPKTTPPKPAANGRPRRQPVDRGTNLHDLLEQEKYDNWREVPFHFGPKKGVLLGNMKQKDLAYWIGNYQPRPNKGTWDEKDLLLDAALCLADAEMGGAA